MHAAPDSTLPDTTSYLHRIRTTMKSYKPPAKRLQFRESYVSADLSTCSHVFIRVDGVRTSLQPPYEGPFLVVERRPKHFVVNVKGKNDTVSVDRLKPAFIEPDPDSNTSRQPAQTTSLPERRDVAKPHETRVTKSGRHVRFPDRLAIGLR